MGTGEMYDYYIRWSHGEESMSAMSVVFKIWHILNKYPRGLRWSEVQHCYSTVYGEMLVLSEEGASSKKKWNAFITPTHSARRKKMVWRVADPSLCHGRLLLVDMTSPTKKVVHEMLRRCFGFTTSKQRHFVLNDIYPLRGAVADEGIWKFVVCFTRQRHADHFYREYASRDSQHAADARVSRIDLLFLKRTLDSMIPHPPPLSSLPTRRWFLCRCPVRPGRTWSGGPSPRPQRRGPVRPGRRTRREEGQGQASCSGRGKGMKLSGRRRQFL